MWHPSATTALVSPEEYLYAIFSMTCTDMSQETLQVIPGNPREILRIPGHSVCKGVFAGPSGPSREAPGVGCKTVLDKKQITREKNKEKEEKKNRRGE